MFEDWSTQLTRAEEQEGNLVYAFRSEVTAMLEFNLVFLLIVQTSWLDPFYCLYSGGVCWPYNSASFYYFLFIYFFFNFFFHYSYSNNFTVVLEEIVTFYCRKLLPSLSIESELQKTGLFDYDIFLFIFYLVIFCSCCNFLYEIINPLRASLV